MANQFVEHLNTGGLKETEIKILDLLKHSRSVAVKNHIFWCCAKLVCRKKPNASVIWDAAISTISLNSSSDAGHHLLRTLIQLGCNVNNERLEKVFKLYLDRRIKYTGASIGQVGH